MTVSSSDDVLTSSALLDTPFAHSSTKPRPTPSPASSTGPPTSPSPPEQKQQSSKPRQLQSTSPRKVAESSTPEKVQQSSSSVFGSTWGSIDSYWSSPFSGEGDGNGKKEGKKTKTVSGSKSGRQSLSAKKLEGQQVQSSGKASSHQSSSSFSKGRSEKEISSSPVATSSPGNAAASSEFVDGGFGNVGGRAKLDVIPSMTSTPLSGAATAKDSTSSHEPSVLKSSLVLSSSPSLRSTTSSSRKEEKSRISETESISPPSSGEINLVGETQVSSPQSQSVTSIGGNEGGVAPYSEDRQDLEKTKDGQEAPSSKDGNEKKGKITDDFPEKASKAINLQEDPEANRSTSDGVQSVGESSSIAEDTDTNGRPKEGNLHPVQAPMSEHPLGEINSSSAGVISGASFLTAKEDAPDLQSSSSKVKSSALLVATDDDSQRATMPLPVGGTREIEAPSGDPDNTSRQVEEVASQADEQETGQDNVVVEGNGVVEKEDSVTTTKDGLSSNPDCHQVLQVSNQSLAYLVEFWSDREENSFLGPGFKLRISVCLKELEEVHRVLEAREKKMVSMSEELVGLMERNQSLQEELQGAREMGDSSMEELRTEFTKRISTAEKKLQTVARVRVCVCVCVWCVCVCVWMSE